ncbi:uncharacterized protein LOC124349777 [Daphnia pulicaria]|uniref:uncharacterized protein LOC124349777 n=1 Tax=Daphnia pulicaria TaxID=35523 RepID=UPI001EEB6BF5|nr:uncharacterized protein LOC124349777 [Daphnia pulicaria]
MSHRAFTPCSPSMAHYPYSPSSNYGFPVDNYSDSNAPNYPHPDASFADLQAFCNRSRNSTAGSAYAPSLPDSDVQSQYFVADLVTTNDAYFPRSRNSMAGSLANSLPDFDTSQYETNDDGVDYGYVPVGNENGGEDEDDDDGADWFDMEALTGLSIDELDENGLGDPSWRFEFPLPMLPVVPVLELKTEIYDGQTFYVDDEGYVQAYTQGECRVPFTGKASIGVWFGPNHQANVSERLHRGRRTQEAARFAAVIEAIRVAGAHGIKKLQINTDYENIIRFMIYFILKWEQNDWMTLRGHHVKNKVVILELDYFSRLLDIKWNYVPYYEGAEGNLEAAHLALEAHDLQLPQVRKTAEEMEMDVVQDEQPKGSTSNEEVTKKRRFVPIVY